MKIAIIAVGKLKDRPARALADDYVGRIARYARVEEIELRDGDAAEVRERFARAIDPRSKVIALEVSGDADAAKESRLMMRMAEACARAAAEQRR